MGQVHAWTPASGGILTVFMLYMCSLLYRHMCFADATAMPLRPTSKARPEARPAAAALQTNAQAVAVDITHRQP